VAVPGNKAPAGTPTGLADTELFAVDAYRRVFDSPVVAVDREQNRLERRINDEIERAREIMVTFLGRAAADDDPALIRTSANLIPREIDPLRTESKGKGNKRVRLEVRDRPQ